MPLFLWWNATRTALTAPSPATVITGEHAGESVAAGSRSHHTCPPAQQPGALDLGHSRKTATALPSWTWVSPESVLLEPCPDFPTFEKDRSIPQEAAPFLRAEEPRAFREGE